MIDYKNEDLELAQSRAGVYEFVFGALASEREQMLRFWSVLGYLPTAEGSMPADASDQAYQHASSLTSIRLEHAGCSSFGTGYVRLQFWDALRNVGLGTIPPVTIGSRWMGMYTRDILQLRDSFQSSQACDDWNLWISPLVSAPLAVPPPTADYFSPFVGLRETLVFGDRFRLAFIQRGGFDRPGFGTFDDSIAFKNTEGSHANVVQPDSRFSTDFYKQAFDFEAAPYGEAHDSGSEQVTIDALNLRQGELFRVERTRAIDCPTGLLQVYSSYMPGEDLRDYSRPGSGNLCAYTVRIASVDKLLAVIDNAEDASRSDVYVDEFGSDAVTFIAPDGYAWIAVSDVE